MRSPQLANIGQGDNPGYSDLQVLRSNAGFYVGTTFKERDENGRELYEAPGSRDSDYFATAEEAGAFLEEMEANENDLSGMEGDLRMTP